MSTSNETADDGKGRKYYRTGSRPTTEVLVRFADPLPRPPRAMALLALSYNGLSQNVKPTTNDRSFSGCAGPLHRPLKRVALVERAEITRLSGSNGNRPRSFLNAVAWATTLARRVHYSALDHAGVVAVVIL